MRTAVRQEPSKIEEPNRDSFLRFRNEWVRTRAREIQRAGSISFTTCSEDTASITALNEFYRSRVLDGFTAERGVEKELDIAMLEGHSNSDASPKMRPRLRSFRCAESFAARKAAESFNTTCRRRAMPESDWSEV